jgi:monovalent cation/hydrogen antiporter
VFPLHAAVQWRRGVRRPAWAVPAVVSWAGTRGVVPLAAALSIPLTTAQGAPLPQRDLVLVLATVVIAVTLVVQGLTLEPLARAAGIGRPGAAGSGHEETLARLRLAEASLARLDELAEARAASDELIDRLRAGVQERIGNTRAGAEDSPVPQDRALTERELRSDLLAAENAELTRLYDAGTIGAATRRQLQHALDLEAARLSDGQR